MGLLEQTIHTDLADESSRTSAGFTANPSPAADDPRIKEPTATKGSRKAVPTHKAKVAEQDRLLAEAEKAEKAAKDAKMKEAAANDAARRAAKKEAERVKKAADEAQIVTETAERRAKRAEEAQNRAAQQKEQEKERLRTEGNLKRIADLEAANKQARREAEKAKLAATEARKEAEKARREAEEARKERGNSHPPTAAESWRPIRPHQANDSERRLLD